MKKLIDITTLGPPMTHQEKVDYLVESVAKGDASFLQDEAYKKILIDSLQGKPHRPKGRVPKQEHVQRGRDFLVAQTVVRFLCENKDMPLYRSEKEAPRKKYNVIEREYIFDKVIALGWKGYGSYPSIKRALENVLSGKYLGVLTIMNLGYYFLYVQSPELSRSVELINDETELAHPIELTNEDIDSARSELEGFIKKKLSQYMPQE